MFEYEDSSVTDAAVGGLNGLVLGDLKLAVHRLPLSMAAVMLKPSDKPILPVIAVSGGGAGAGADTGSSSSLRASANNVSVRSTVLRLVNMATKEDLADDKLYEVRLHTAVVAAIIFCYYCCCCCL